VLLFFLIPRRRNLRSLVGMFALAMFLAGASGCGFSAGQIKTTSPGTTPGTYTITVTGTSGSQKATTTVQLTVQ
jgi:hypothetical protein